MGGARLALAPRRDSPCGSGDWLAAGCPENFAIAAWHSLPPTASFPLLQVAMGVCLPLRGRGKARSADAGPRVPCGERGARGERLPGAGTARPEAVTGRDVRTTAPVRGPRPVARRKAHPHCTQERLDIPRGQGSSSATAAPRGCARAVLPMPVASQALRLLTAAAVLYRRTSLDWLTRSSGRFCRCASSRRGLSILPSVR